tara:strand:+ start:1509 stop:1688 length:180 start_codon:yes stop_codon:yes gene_type:complete
MTGYTVHTGSNDKFRDGWDSIFADSKTDTGKSDKRAGAKASKKKPRKASGKKSDKKKKS